MVALAIAVTVALIGLERDHDGCQDAARSVFLSSNAPESRLRSSADVLARECGGAEPLNRAALGLRIERPSIAARLARTAAAREPESYVAWGILAVAAPPSEAAAAARRARALNPLSATTAHP